jgi:NTE family protein
MKRLLLLSGMLLFLSSVRAQKVGLVFSGGGAKGLAHIGVLKALEENNIPIDYIVGTSLGVIVCSLSAGGYTPSEIEALALSKNFQDWVNGRFDSEYRYYFRKKTDNPSFLSAKLQVDTGFQVRIRSNLINDIPLNFALLELLSRASANAHDNFDNLFVPFRCIVSDVFSQKMIPVSGGNLVEAVRGTFTVPLIYRPVKVDGKYVLDGGLYNNFPVDVLKEDFKPDYIIGTNVSSKIFNEYPKDNDEKLMSKFLVYMFLSKSDSTSIGKNGTYIQPDVSGYSVTNFQPVEELIKKGYDATMANMPAIKAAIARRSDNADLNSRREAFKNRSPDLKFSTISITDVNSNQKKYVENVFRYNKDTLDLADIRRGYYRLVADDNFETVFPRISYKPEENSYDFQLQVQRQKNFKVDIGGALSNRSISNAYIGLQYNYLTKHSFTLSTDFYTGGFYESFQAMSRMDISGKLPFFLEAKFTYNHWNYLNTSKIFVEHAKPTFLEQSDRLALIKGGFPLSHNGKFEMRAAYLNFNNHYSPNNSFKTGDLLDETEFNGMLSGFSLEKNTLNKKQYATRGLSFELSGNYYMGVEEYLPGNIFRNESFFPTIDSTRINRNWGTLKLSLEQYPFNKGIYAFGFLMEGVLSNKPLFSNYQSTLLSAPAFFPLQDSKTIYLKNFRANSYGAFGIKNIFQLRKHLDLRLESYVFQPFKEFTLSGPQGVKYNNLFNTRYYAATADFVYQTPVGPASLSFNYYDDKQKQFGVMFHIGYLLFNKRSFE